MAIQKKHSSKTGKLRPLIFEIVLQQQMGWWAQTVAKHHNWRRMILKESP
jgi:hypothetical protein